MDIDVMLYEGKDSDFHLAMYLDKPGMGQHFYMPARHSEWLFNTPSQMSFTHNTYTFVFPSGHLAEFSLRHAIGKMIEGTFLYVAGPIFFNICLISESMLADEVKTEGGFLNSHQKQMEFGFGVEGLKDSGHYSDQQISFYPAVGNKSKFSPEFKRELPSEFQSFVDNFEKIVYISFGSIFNPPHEVITKMRETIRLAQ